MTSQGADNQNRQKSHTTCGRHVQTFSRLEVLKQHSLSKAAAFGLQQRLRSEDQKNFDRTLSGNMFYFPYHTHTILSPASTFVGLQLTAGSLQRSQHTRFPVTPGSAETLPAAD